MKRLAVWKTSVLALALAALGARTGRADMAPVYPLETLAFAASSVVEATIGES